MGNEWMENNFSIHDTHQYIIQRVTYYTQHKRQVYTLKTPGERCSCFKVKNSLITGLHYCRNSNALADAVLMW